MRRSYAYLSIALAALTGLTVGLYIRSSNTGINVKAETSKVDEAEIIKRLREWKVESFYTWDVGDTENESLRCLIQSLDEKTQEEGRRVKLTIFNPSGMPIHEEYFDNVMRVYQSYALRNSPPQLVLEAVYGGTGTYHLQMFDYLNGQIVKLIEGEDGLFNANADVRPQFRGGVVPAAEPYQIMLTEGVGLASSTPKYTRVYRYKKNAYEYVGKFPQQKLDDYMEGLLKGSQNH